jgi:hypothetical protein
MLLLRHFEEGDQLGGGDEPDALAESAQGQAERNGHMRFNSTITVLL